MPEKPPMLNKQNLVVATVASVVSMTLAACTLLASFVPPIAAVGLAVLSLGVGTWATLLHLPISGMPAPPDPAIPPEEYPAHGIAPPEQPDVRQPWYPTGGNWHVPPKGHPQHNEWVDPVGTPPGR